MAVVVVAVAFVVSILLVGFMRGGGLSESSDGSLRVEELRVEPAVAQSGSPLSIRGVLRNRGSKPLRSVFIATAVSTDAAPGTQALFSSDGGIEGLPLLAPGSGVPFHTTVTFRGDGWVRAGVIGWSAEETMLPVTRRILIVQPILSTLELLTLACLLAGIGASFVGGVALLGRQSRDATTTGRTHFTVVLGTFSVAAALATWLSTAVLLRTAPPETLRLMAYGGVILFAFAWILLGQYMLRRTSLTSASVLLGLYADLGAFWITSFYVWRGLRPTAIGSTPQFWIEALLWPLHIAQSLFGLRFA